jgi:ABC-type phosphate/phosphonate transport system substrate-binding protein
MSQGSGGWSRRDVCAAALAALAGATLPAWAEERARGRVPDPVKLGLVGSLFREVPSPLVLFAMQPFKAYLEDQMKVKSELLASGDPVELGRELRLDQVHLGVFHGVEFAWAKRRYPTLKPLFIAVNGVAELRAHLIVKQGGAGNLADLKKKSLVIPYRTREHCWMFLERRCVPAGKKPSEQYRIRKLSSPDYALDQVGEGSAAAALIDGADWDAYRKAYPGPASKLQPLLTSEPLPCAVVAYHDKQLDPKLLERFQDGMINANKTPEGRKMLDVMRITHFAKVPDDFDKQLEAAAKAYPPPAK